MEVNGDTDMKVGTRGGGYRTLRSRIRSQMSKRNSCMRGRALLSYSQLGGSLSLLYTYPRSRHVSIPTHHRQEKIQNEENRKTRGCTFLTGIGFCQKVTVINHSCMKEVLNNYMRHGHLHLIL